MTAFKERHQHHRARGTVHSRLIGGIITDVVVVNYICVLEWGKLIIMGELQTKKLLINVIVDWSIDQPAAYRFLCQCPCAGVDVGGGFPTSWQSGKHAYAPGISPKEPVAHGYHVGMILPVA